MYFELVNRQDQSTCDRFWKDSHFFITFLGKKKKGRVEKKKAYDIWGKELVEGSLCRRTMTKYYWIMTKYWI